MEFVEVSEANIADAGYIHAESWKDSHRDFCTAEFVRLHTPEAQAKYLRMELAAGKQVWMLLAPRPVGIVSVQGSLIENLYVLPGEQNRGYGTALLEYAASRCTGAPTLWVLNINEGACRLYRRSGFQETGRRKRLNAQLSEIELARYEEK